MMLKIVCELFAVILLLTGCMAPESAAFYSDAAQNEDVKMQSPASIPSDTAYSTLSKPTAPEQTKPKQETDQTYILDLEKRLPPENITNKFGCGYSAVISPNKDFMVIDAEKLYIWNSESQKKVEVQELISPSGLNNTEKFISFLSNKTVYAITGLPGGTGIIDGISVSASLAEVDWGNAIISVDGSAKPANFEYQLAKATGKSVSLGDICYNPNLSRHYATANIFDETNQDGYPVVYCAAAEYDSNYQLLNYIVAETYKPYQEKKMGLVSNSIVAAGERRVLSSQNIEFNFNNITWRQTDYLPNIRELSMPGLIKTHRDSRFDGIQFQLLFYSASGLTPNYVLVGYENGQFQTFFGLNEIEKGGVPYEVQTEQGPVQMQYAVSGTAPRKDFTFTAPCEEYTWTVPKQWASLLSAESYQQGVFQATTEGKIQFICPLPEQVKYVGEDINGLSYFYDRREI